MLHPLLEWHRQSSAAHNKVSNVARTLTLITTMLAFPAVSFGAQWVLNLTPAQAIAGSSDGMYVQILTSEAIINPAACANADSYIIHDPAIVQGALAVGLSAIASGRQIRVFVTDACDGATGRPLVSSIGLM